MVRKFLFSIVLSVVLFLSFSEVSFALDGQSFMTTVFNKNDLANLLRKLEGIGIKGVDGSGIITSPVFRNALEATNFEYLNHDLLPMILAHSCYRVRDKTPLLYKCQELKRSGTIGFMTLDNLVASVSAYLERPEVVNNKNTVAYYVLDDWEVKNDPGGARGVLETVHRLIDESNRKHGLNRKSVCYFMAWMARVGETNYRGFGDNAYNFTSKGCDYIAINSYAAKSYGKSVNNDDYDWDMKFLSQVKSKLMNQPAPFESWDPNKTPLIGGVQTFGDDPNKPPPSTSPQQVPAPRRNDVKRQTLGFCSQGASVIWFWPWQGYRGGGGNQYIGPDTNVEIYNGVLDGISACNSLWKKDLPGDANGDGKVNEADLDQFIKPNFGRVDVEPFEKAKGNFNRDTRVDGLDYVLWLNNYTR